MIRAITLFAMTSAAIAFQPAGFGTRRTALQASTLSEIPYFANVEEAKIDESETVVAQESFVPTPPTTVPPVLEKKPAPKKLAPKKLAPKKANPAHKEGVFSPMVLFLKGVMGDAALNKVRAKAISLHSDVIASFVDTSDSAFGDAVLRSLFKVADKDGNGTICKEELQAALQSLGFSWLQEKQINGIFKRADTDGNGSIDMDEWIAEAPKTLRTNLTKLAKKNGGELGFLV